MSWQKPLNTCFKHSHNRDSKTIVIILNFNLKWWKIVCLRDFLLNFLKIVIRRNLSNTYDEAFSRKKLNGFSSISPKAHIHKHFFPIILQEGLFIYSTTPKLLLSIIKISQWKQSDFISKPISPKKSVYYISLR